MSHGFDLQLLHDCKKQADKACRLACYFCMNEIMFDKLVIVSESTLSLGGKMRVEKCSLSANCEIYKYGVELNDKMF